MSNIKSYYEMIERNRFLNTRLTNGLINSSKDIVFSKIKNTFGSEFYIDNATENTMFNTGIIDFLKQYDKNFEEHYDPVRERLYPFVSIGIIDPRTFILIATKYNVPGKMQSSVMEDKMNADLYIYIFGHNCRRYAAELTQILDDRDKGSRNDIIYTVNSIGGSRGTDISCLNLQKREMDTLIFSNNEIGQIRDFINRFNNGNSFYREKQLCYKTGILLYGKPGTGKTSLVKAIATEFHRGIVQIEVSNINSIDFSHLTMMINNEDEEKYIVLFEDIDTLFLNRDEVRDDKDYNSMINKLLQFLDSNSSPDDVIFIATTNHLDRLDEALIREGRFDLKLEVDEITREDVTRFIETFDLPGSLTEEIIGIYVEKKRQEFIDKNIKRMEADKSTDKKKFRYSKEEREDIAKEMDMSEFNPNFTRFNQSLMQNIIMSKINKSDKIESVIDTGDVVKDTDEEY